jgi:hypothetical protein
LNVEWYVYRGTNLTTTREFCELLTKKEYVHKSEIPELLKGHIDGHQCRIYDKTGLPYGMKEGTNADNFIVNRGGWNCGHQLIPVRTEAVPEAIRNRVKTVATYPEYRNHDEKQWYHAYFNSENGGYLVVDRERIEHSKVSKNEKAKYDKEYAMAKVFAENGYRIEMLKEISGVSSPDVTINGMKAELKRLSSHNNLVRYAKKATEKQGAEIALFEFEKMNVETMKELMRLKDMNIRIKYYLTNDKNHIIDL